MVHLPPDQQHWTMSLIYTINDAYLELFSCDTGHKLSNLLLCCQHFWHIFQKCHFFNKYIGNHWGFKTHVRTIKNSWVKIFVKSDFETGCVVRGMFFHLSCDILLKTCLSGMQAYISATVRIIPQHSLKPLLLNKASLMKLRGQPKGHRNNVLKTNHFSWGRNFVRPMHHGCREDVSDPWPVRQR